MKSDFGFTLIEMITVVAIVGILSAVAMPSYTQIIKQDRIVSTANELMSTFKMARSEAVKQEKIVTLTATDSSWSASVDGEEFVVFNNDKPGVILTGLNTQTINSLGEAPSTSITISDGDDDTTDRCFRVHLSGQNKIEQGGCQ